MPATSVVTNEKFAGGFVTGSFVLDLASVPANEQATDTAAISQAKVGDVVIVTPRAALTEGLAVKHAFVSADGTVTVVLHNHTGTAIDEGSATFDYALFRGALNILW